jgi:hypothetical protein
MSSSTALTTAPKLYEPVFNPDTNTYEDDCPWQKGWRGTREPHKCFCNANVLFNTRSVFKQHILSGKHKQALKEYNTGKDETKAIIKEFHIKIDQSERAKNKLEKENAKLKERLAQNTTHNERQSVIISTQKEELANNSTEATKQKTKHRKLKNKHTELTDYLEIVESESKNQATRINELEAYLKILEERGTALTPLSPPPPLSPPARPRDASDNLSPPPAPRKKPQGDSDEDDNWHDLSDED